MHDEEDRRAILISEVMTPDKANFFGNVHGGYIMKKCDHVAYVCAARYSGHYAVTLSVDHILFKKPIHVGELVSFYATINHVGRTSMEVGIKVVAEHLLTQEKRHTNSCFFTMVAVDENMKPTAVRPLELRNETEKRRFEEAVLRKEINQSFKQEHERRKKELRSRFSQK